MNAVLAKSSLDWYTLDGVFVLHRLHLLCHSCLFYFLYSAACKDKSQRMIKNWIPSYEQGSFNFEMDLCLGTNLQPKFPSRFHFSSHLKVRGAVSTRKKKVRRGTHHTTRLVRSRLRILDTHVVSLYNINLELSTLSYQYQENKSFSDVFPVCLGGRSSLS